MPVKVTLDTRAREFQFCKIFIKPHLIYKQNIIQNEYISEKTQRITFRI